MSNSDFQFQLTTLEKEVSKKLDSVYGKRWTDFISKTIDQSGPIDKDRIPELTKFLLSDLVNMSMLVGLESVGQKIFKYGIVPEITDRILLSIEKACEFANAESITELDSEIMESLEDY